MIRALPVILLTCCALLAAPVGALASDISYSRFRQAVSAGRIEAVTIDGSELSGSFVDSDEPFSSYAPAVTAELLQFLAQNDVTVVAKPRGEPLGFLYLGLLVLVAVLVLLVAGIYWRVRRVEQAIRDLEPK